jgi:hypothetical protein
MLAVLATLARTSSSGLHVTLDDGSALLVLATLARTIRLVALYAVNRKGSEIENKS